MIDRPHPAASIGADRREHPRMTAQLAARLVLERGRTLDVVIVDRSLKGMRVRLPAEGPLPRRLSVLVLRDVVVHEADVVWTRQKEAGLALRSSVSVRAATGAQGEALRQLWRDTMMR